MICRDGRGFTSDSIDSEVINGCSMCGWLDTTGLFLGGFREIFRFSQQDFPGGIVGEVADRRDDPGKIILRFYGKLGLYSCIRHGGVGEGQVTGS